jgi:hypothetical protein
MYRKLARSYPKIGMDVPKISTHNIHWCKGILTLVDRANDAISDRVRGVGTVMGGRLDPTRPIVFRLARTTITAATGACRRRFLGRPLAKQRSVDRMDRRKFGYRRSAISVVCLEAMGLA